MSGGGSIRTRLIWAAAVVLLVFLAGAGWVVQKAHADSVLTQHYARLQTTVYLLMAQAELDANGTLVMPTTLAEPRLSLPGSGLYARITRADQTMNWQSGSALGQRLPSIGALPPGQWRLQANTVDAPGANSAGTHALLSTSLGVLWSVGAQSAPLVFSALEDKATFDLELRAFERTLWSWLSATGLVLLATQTALLHWAFRPLQQMAQEVARVEHGQQLQLQGHYPLELAGLARNLNLLIDQERGRQTRYRQALDDLAHSLKTPLAVLRATLSEPADLPQRVAEQVCRMDDIVVHQLGRAGAAGSALFAPALALAPLLQRIHATLAKVYAERQLHWSLDCPDTLSWRIGEGDAFELLGNLMDNAAKWARQQATVTLWIDAAQGLCIRVQDDGPGFANPQVIGQRRVRLDEQTPGHGIGLAVVKDLVDSHGGTLRVSRSPLGGAQVDVVLPGSTPIT
ncbi:MAG: ATP-binding protein [Rhodoferax sp.]|nr:ATP-binding protein [Rhodoferax sp.]